MTDVFNADGTSADPVDQLVGEGKKFKTVEDLARGKVESDAYIERLKAEMADLRADLSKRVNVEAELTALREEMLERQKAPATRDNTNPQLTPESIRKMVSDTVTQVERERSAAQNVLMANSAVIEAFGGDLAKATDHVKAKASELGISIQDLKDIAAKSPTAFQKMVLAGVEVTTKRDTDSAPPKSTVDFSRQTDTRLKEGTKAYYDDLRKRDPKAYWKPSVQTAIFNAIKAGTYEI